MIIDGLLAAEPHLDIARRVFDPKKYLYLTDDIMPRIEESTEPVCLPRPDPLLFCTGMTHLHYRVWHQRVRSSIGSVNVIYIALWNTKP